MTIIEAKRDIQINLSFYDYEADFITGHSYVIELAFRCNYEEIVENPPLLQGHMCDAEKFIIEKYHNKILAINPNLAHTTIHDFKTANTIFTVYNPTLEKCMTYLLRDELDLMFKFSTVTVTTIEVLEFKKRILRVEK